LLPELAALRFTEFSNINFPSKLKTYFPIIDMLSRHCFNVTVETGLDHWPNIYCGVLVFVLLPLYVLQKEIPLRQKVPKLLLLAFMLVSFSTNVLNFIWHGLNYPDSLPARQSFLYILLLLTVCYEAFLYIHKYSGSMIGAVYAGILFFLLFCEKMATDDAVNGTCFLITGFFLLIYAGLIYYDRKYENYNSNASRLLCICAIIMTVAESGVNTYLTSVPTVSRTTYLSNYDSYQILTDRTVQNEEGDFFRFEKFARRTQNDAMLIGFQGGSYFSSTLNSLVSDFYEQYGMRASRVNYCYEGATPVTAALLSTRSMLYTLDRGHDNLFELADTEGN
ncbi:MAG: YfhO family protein, partial [Lachnospiraceae bacterium]|nr:YfhO family protein [Lachnospiraceae bacterium]